MLGQKSYLLDLNKQILNDFDWIIAAVINMFQLATIIFTLADTGRSFPFHKQNVGRCIPCCFRKVKLFACTKQRKQLRLLKRSGLRTAQLIIKAWKDSDEPSTERMEG